MSGPHPAVAAVRSAVRAALADLAGAATPATPGAAPGARLVLAAVSGGADSLALAAALAFEAPGAGLRAGAVVVDHGLQVGSAGVGAAAAATCRDLALAPVIVRPVRVGETGRGPEADARRARYDALGAAADDRGAVAVLLGHTLDDQAETVLLALARGSGTRSLSGMARRRGRWRRPLLDLPRTTTRAACAAQGLVVWDDPHNGDPRFARVRARAVLRQLEDRLGPGVVVGLARSAALARDDADALDDLAAAAHADLGGGHDLSVVGLLALAPAVRRRVLRRVTGPAATSTHLAAVEALVTRWHGQGPVALPGGASARRLRGRVVVERAAGPVPTPGR